MRRRVLPFSLGLLAAVVLVVGVFSLQGRHAQAITNIGPDPNEYDNISAWYQLSNTPDVLSTTMIIPVYVPTLPAVSETIGVSYLADANAVGIVHFNGGATGNPGSFTIPRASFNLDTNTGYYRATITGTIGGVNANGNYKSYQVTTGVAGNPAGGKIGYSASGNTGHFAIANAARCDNPGRTDGCGVYHMYTIPFAPACNVNPSGTNPQQIQIVDADNPNNTFGQYSIQPEAFTMTVYDTTNGKVRVPGQFEAGSWGNGQTRTLNFNATQYHHYELDLVHVYSNNVIQFHLPYDSINTLVTCPSGGIQPVGGGGVSGYCQGMNGYMWDQSDLSAPYAAMQYYVYVNPIAGTPQTFADWAAVQDWVGNANPALEGFRGPGNANLANPAGTPAGVPANHGFHVDIPADVSQYNWNGQTANNTYWVYAKSANGPNIKRIGAVTVPPCGFRPFFNVNGGDIAAGCGPASNADITSWNNNNTNGSGWFGAGSQIGAFATGKLDGFISASGNNGNQISLSFTNSVAAVTNPANGLYGGKLGDQECVPDYAGAALPLATSGGSPTIDLGSFAIGQTVIQSYGTNIKVHGTLPKGANVTLVVYGAGHDAFIDGRIDYNYPDYTQVPRLNLYVQDGDIDVGYNVDYIHGNFVAQHQTGANGVFYSCANNGGSPISLGVAGDFNTCKTTPLTVYGSVSAQSLELHRTSGDLVSGQGPAENFVYGPELWLGQNGNAPSTAAGTYQAITGLPPVL